MSSPETNRWHFLTSHAQVLLCLQRHPDTRLRDIAETVGITERAAQRIVKDLIEEGFATSERIGRRSRYTINRRAHMRHPSQIDQEVGELLDVLRLDSAHNG